MLAAAAAAALGYRAHAAGTKCDPVHGFFSDYITSPPPALATAGTVLGELHGDLTFALTGLTPSTTPNVAFFDARSTISTKTGDIYIAEAGSTDSVTRNFADLWTVAGGTGEYLGATGQIFANGAFDFSTGTGQAEYRGTVCRQ
jgi:hypothetical protein